MARQTRMTNRIFGRFFRTKNDQENRPRDPHTFRIGSSSRDIKASLPLKLTEYTEKVSNALAPQKGLKLLKQ